MVSFHNNETLDNTGGFSWLLMSLVYQVTISLGISTLIEAIEGTPLAEYITKEGNSVRDNLCLC